MYAVGDTIGYAQTTGTITEIGDDYVRLVTVSGVDVLTSNTDPDLHPVGVGRHRRGEDGRPIVYQFDTTALDFVASDGRRFNTVQEAETYSADANA